MKARTNGFLCPEESQFYGRCVRELVLENCCASAHSIVVELGSGDGSALARHVAETRFQGCISGYDIHLPSVKRSKRVVEHFCLQQHYSIEHGDFFSLAKADLNKIAISNPPYLPCERSPSLMPELWGGPDGNASVLRLLSMGFGKVMVMLSSYSSTYESLSTAMSLGYTVIDWRLRPMRFGKYSRESGIALRISQLSQLGKAVVTERGYLLAAVLFAKCKRPAGDRMKLLEMALCGRLGETE
jgi:methylase of polypeptide subunit release factors